MNIYIRRGFYTFKGEFKIFFIVSASIYTLAWFHHFCLVGIVPRRHNDYFQFQIYSRIPSFVCTNASLYYLALVILNFA